MNRQSTSKRMFGLVMIAVTLLLVACGNGDGDADPTATSEANQAAPTLPAGEGTAEVEATEDISEDDLTVVDPEIPAASATAEEDGAADVGSPDGTPPATTEIAEGTVSADASTPGAGPTDLTGSSDEVIATPPVQDGSDASTPADTVSTPEVVEDAPSPVSAEVVGVVEDDAVETASTPEDAASPAAATDGATPASTPTTGHFNTPGDGTGGSGQPGESSSNVPGQEEVVASPIAGISVEGCEVPNVPAFESEVVNFITSAEVNFRSGPGIDCDPILGEPLAPDVAVVVIGGPVTQSSDNTVWLQVEVDGVPGWVSEEFVEPTE